MNLVKISKNIVFSVLCGCVVSACDSTSTMLSLMDEQQKTATLSSIPPTVWADLGGRFQLARGENIPEVKTQIAWLQAHKDALYDTLQTSAPYISYVYEETKKRGLPAELALLPVVESEGNPLARSESGASGLWQLMPLTATGLGLKSDAAYDARKDIIASTSAALDYLSDLHQTFADNWLLAMAAYNEGPHNLQTAIQAQKKWYASVSFWDLDLPDQTERYVPKVLALAAIIRNPARYGMELPPVKDQPRLAAAKVHSPLELKTLVAAAGANMETVHQLNPAYRKLSASMGTPNNFLIPVAQTEGALLDKIKADDKSMLHAVAEEGKWLVLALTTTLPEDMTLKKT